MYDTNADLFSDKRSRDFREKKRKETTGASRDALVALLTLLHLARSTCCP